MSKIIIGTLLIVASVLIVTVVSEAPDEGEEFTKKRVCPDSWVDNQMPGVQDDFKSSSRQYFIIDGERKEIEDYDLDWILENCDIKPQVVY